MLLPQEPKTENTRGFHPQSSSVSLGQFCYYLPENRSFLSIVHTKIPVVLTVLALQK